MGDLSNYIRTRRRPESGKDSVRKIEESEAEADAQYPHPHDGGLNSEVTRSFLSQLAAAMQFMRGKNIVHRDIKPQVSRGANDHLESYFRKTLTWLVVYFIESTFAET